MKRPILYILIPFCAGIALSAHINISVLSAIIISALLLVISVLSILLKSTNLSDRISHAGLYMAVLFLAIVLCKSSGSLGSLHIAGMAKDQPCKVVVRCIVKDDPVSKRTRYGSWVTSFISLVSSAKYTDRDSVPEPRYGLMSVRINGRKPATIEFGDEVVLEGKLSRPCGLKNPGLFDYSKYLANKGIYAILNVSDLSSVSITKKRPANLFRRAAYNLRHTIRRLIDKNFSQPDSGFLKAILIGDRSHLDPEIKDAFIKTGTVHMLAISGLHVAIIAAILMLIFNILRLPRKINLAFTMLALIFYSFVAGSSPPIVRSVIMFSVFVIGYIIDRDYDGVNALALAALIILMVNPKALFDAGFQLSFISVAGIIILTPKIEKLLGVGKALYADSSVLKKIILYILKAISVSLAAWISAWPVVARYFNILTPVAIIVNLIALPVLFIIMIASMLFLLIGQISVSLASFIANLITIADSMLFYICQLFSKMPFAYLRIGSPVIGIIICYYALLLLWIRKTAILSSRPRIDKSRALIAILLILNIIVWFGCFDTDSDALKITFLDVGGGDCCLLEFPGGGNMLIDAGEGTGSGFDIGKNVVAPYLWNKGIYKIDLVIITHMHEDHVGGIIYLLENFKVDRIVDSGLTNKGRLYEEYNGAVKRSGARRIIARAHDKIVLSLGGHGDLNIFVVSPDSRMADNDENTKSLVAKITYKDNDVLFCADTTSLAMEEMLRRYGDFLDSDLIKAPHHGGYAGSDRIVKMFFDTVSPRAAIVSVGSSRRYDKRRNSSAKHLSCKTFVTADNGAIEVKLRADKSEILPFVR